MSNRKKLGLASFIIFITGIIVGVWPTSKAENFSAFASEGLIAFSLIGLSLIW